MAAHFPVSFSPDANATSEFRVCINALRSIVERFTPSPGTPLSFVVRDQMTRLRQGATQLLTNTGLLGPYDFRRLVVNLDDILTLECLLREDDRRSVLARRRTRRRLLRTFLVRVYRLTEDMVSTILSVDRNPHLAERGNRVALLGGNGFATPRGPAMAPVANPLVPPAMSLGGVPPGPPTSPMVRAETLAPPAPPAPLVASLHPGFDLPLPSVLLTPFQRALDEMENDQHDEILAHADYKQEEEEEDEISDYEKDYGKKKSADKSADI